MTESLASSRKPSQTERQRKERERGTEESRRGVGMVAAGDAGLNINPRGRPGRAPVLVWFRLNSRNHAANVVARSSQTVPAKNEKRACERTEGPTERRTEGGRDRRMAGNHRSRGKSCRTSRQSATTTMLSPTLTSYPW